MSKLFDAKAFQNNLQTQCLGRYLIYRESSESTMDLAQRELDEGAPSGTLVLAETQTKGRGRAGRTWESAPAKNLYFTFIFQVRDFDEAMKMNFATPVAIIQACQEEGESDLGIKWPNDIWTRKDRKKICGILTNSTIVRGNTWVIVGIGINVNEKLESESTETRFPQNIQTIATSLYEIFHHEIMREKLLARICNHLEDLVTHMNQKVMGLYQKYDLICSQEVIFVYPKGRQSRDQNVDKELKEGEEAAEQDEVYLAKAIGFQENGALRVRELSSGREIELLCEEVSIRLY